MKRAMVLLGFVLCVFPALGMAAQVQVAADTYVSSTSPATNFSSQGAVNVGGGSYGLALFDPLSGLPAGTTAGQIKKATLTFFVNRITTAGAVDALQVMSPWSPGTVTYGTAPLAGAIVASTPVGQGYAFYTVDITSLAQAWVSNPVQNFGIKLASSLSAPATVVSVDSADSTGTSHPMTLDIVLASVTQIDTGAGLSGGPITSTGTISIPNGGVSNGMLEHSGITVNTGPGLSGGGTVALGGTLNLSSTASGGSVTGVTASSPLSSSGSSTTPNISLSGVVPIANGGTGAATSAAARGNLGAASLGANTFTDTQSISSGNLVLPATTSAGSGVIMLGANQFGSAFGTDNTFLGATSGNFTMSGTQNIGIGRNVLSANTTGTFNTAIGAQALRSNSTGFFNTAIGHETLRTNTTGIFNTAIGRQALASNTTGANNTATGGSSLFSNTTGRSNTATGVGALSGNTIGNNNTATGSSALALNSTGNNNTAVGTSALSNNTASSNTAMGYAALLSNTTGESNTAIGDGTLPSNASGNSNTAIGHSVLENNATGNRNTAIGDSALFDTLGDNNIGLGFEAGRNVNAGSNNIDIGNTGVAGDLNTIRIGTTGTQTQTFIAGINGVNISGSPVVVDSNGQLGIGAASTGTGTVTQVNTGAGLTGGPITGTGTLSIPAGGVANAMLANSSITVNTGAGLTGGGTVSLGGTLSLSSTASGTVTGVTASAPLSSDGSSTTPNIALSGVVPVANGGTGANTAASARTNLGAASLSANSFAGTQTISSGNLDLPVTSNSGSGVLTLNGNRFAHAFGSANTFVGLSAGNFTTTGTSNIGIGNNVLSNNTNGSNNTAVGSSSLTSNTTGGNNTAAGNGSLTSNTSGAQNTAIGAAALNGNTTGNDNTAIGNGVLGLNSSGAGNTAVGRNSLFINSSGSNNTAVGVSSGQNITGSNNVDIANQGQSSDSGTIRIGTIGSQTRTFIAGINGVSVSGGSPVVVNSNGQLGTTTASSGTVTQVDSGAGLVGGPITGTGTLSIAPNGVTNGMLANNSITVNTSGGLSGGGIVALGGTLTLNAATIPIANGGTGANDAATALGNLSAASLLGPNSFKGNQTITTDASGNGNLVLPGVITNKAGAVMLGTNRFAHAYGTDNTFLGTNAGNFTTSGTGENTGIGNTALSANTTGDSNTAVGSAALASNTFGNDNTATGYQALTANTGGLGNTSTGYQALTHNTFGNSNTASGVWALVANTTGQSNTATGSYALKQNFTGSQNTAVGSSALESATGSNNIGVGFEAGKSVFGSNNIHVGNIGQAPDANTIRIGTTQTRTFISGIYNNSIADPASCCFPVVVDVNGQLSRTTATSGGVTSVTASSPLAAIAGTTPNISLTGMIPIANGGTGANTAAAARTGLGAASLGANSFTGSQSVSNGNLDLPSTSGSDSGGLTLGGSSFAHAFGTANTFVGTNAGNFTMSGTGKNTAIGFQALNGNTTGFDLTATGYNALAGNTTGAHNTADGYEALLANLSGDDNTATGYHALKSSTSDRNTGIGYLALGDTTTGTENTALGYHAGINLTTGNLNVDIANGGVAGESSTIRIGTSGDQTKTYIAGINGVNVIGSGVAVVVSPSGQLGTISSSRRYKHDIQDMDEASRGLLKLRPVTFRYNEAAADGSQPLQYGLIAEEVAEVYPNLVQYDKDGQVQTVLYHILPSLLLNEVQKQQQQIDTLSRQVKELTQVQSELQQLRAELERMKAGRQ